MGPKAQVLGLVLYANLRRKVKQFVVVNITGHRRVSHFFAKLTLWMWLLRTPGISVLTRKNIIQLRLELQLFPLDDLQHYRVPPVPSLTRVLLLAVLGSVPGDMLVCAHARPSQRLRVLEGRNCFSPFPSNLTPGSREVPPNVCWINQIIVSSCVWMPYVCPVSDTFSEMLL